MFLHDLIKRKEKNIFLKNNYGYQKKIVFISVYDLYFLIQIMVIHIYNYCNYFTI